MSHHATNWAIQQRGLQPATKLVLWYLADRHNPDFGCFPSQEQLAADCEMSRRSVNRHLDELEQRGLIRREERIDPRTKRQRPTRYVLAFEPDFARAAPSEPCASMAHGSGTDEEHSGEPCANMAHGSEPSRVPSVTGAVCHSCGTRITSKLTSNDDERVRACACEAEPSGAVPGVAPGLTGAGCEDSEAGPSLPGGPAGGGSGGGDTGGASATALVARICEAMGAPELAETRWWRIEADFGRRIDAWRQLGLSDRRIVEVAREFARDVPELPQGPKGLDAAMVRAAQRISGERRGECSAPAAQSARPLPDGVRDTLDLLGRAIAEGRYVPPSAVTPGAAREMLARGLVTAEQLQARGIAA
ncbi:helix-turn-helix domain-containing protein [Tabrizicola thermarum]|uniref:helix-turn-helix domain-containing protein n=1 Tax=Tabrizicola thermarum TaxID=2670345 RepID=UPI00192E6EDE|nr:helix-turn-helix domain-containing protein [Tabrizicola thermarum]